MASSVATFAAIPAGYYSTLEGKKKADLKAAAKSVVLHHTVISYGSPTWEAFEQTDVHTVGGQLVWWDMYSDNNVPVSSGHPDLNIEHSVPNSWWGKTQNDAYKDLFHLNPSDVTANTRKANYPLGVVSTVSWTNGVTTVGRPANGACGGAPNVFEPADKYKGDFARAYFYMFTVYDDINWSVSQSDRNFMFDGTSYPSLRPWAYELLLKWAAEDPVDEKERNRNEAIYAIQHNRNPFIDFPSLAEYIWGSKQTEAFTITGGSVTPDPDPDIDPDPDPIGATSLDCNFDASSSLSYYKNLGWTVPNVGSGNSCWQVKTFDGNNYACASAYKIDAAGAPFESWLVSPAIDFSGEKAANCLTFRTQGAYRSDDCSLKVFLLNNPDPSKATVKIELPAAICTPNERRTAGDTTSPIYSDWVQSGKVFLSGVSGAGYIGFQYISLEGGTSQNIATYCVDDVKVAYDSSLSGVAEPEAVANTYSIATPAPGLICIYAAVPPQGTARIFDMAGRTVATVSLADIAEVSVAPGLYIIAFPEGQPVKILVR